MRRIIILFLCITSSIFTSATFKLKPKYVMRTGFDNFYLTFLNKESFELEMYSCLYQIKLSGTYKTDRDTIRLSYEKYENLDDERKNWVAMDSAQIAGEQNFLQRYSKLIREDRDKLLRIPDTRSRRVFRDIHEPYSGF